MHNIYAYSSIIIADNTKSIATKLQYRFIADLYVIITNVLILSIVADFVLLPNLRYVY